MKHCTHHRSFFSRRKERMLKKMANMRAAKERKRLAAGPRDEEPSGKLVRHPNLSWAMRDESSGDTVWMPMLSARDSFRRITKVLKFYEPNHPRHH